MLRTVLQRADPQQTWSGPRMSTVLKLKNTRKEDGRVGPEQNTRGSGVREQGAGSREGAGSRSPLGRASLAEFGFDLKCDGKLYKGLIYLF